jgi:hypothetical protein
VFDKHVTAALMQFPVIGALAARAWDISDKIRVFACETALVAAA